MEIFAWIAPVKLNYETIVERRGLKVPSLLKMTSQEMSEAAHSLKEVLRKGFINLIYLSKFLVISYHKQTYKGGRF